MIACDAHRDAACCRAVARSGSCALSGATALMLRADTSPSPWLYIISILQDSTSRTVYQRRRPCSCSPLRGAGSVLARPRWHPTTSTCTQSSPGAVPEGFSSSKPGRAHTSLITARSACPIRPGRACPRRPSRRSFFLTTFLPRHTTGCTPFALRFWEQKQDFDGDARSVD